MRKGLKMKDTAEAILKTIADLHMTQREEPTSKTDEYMRGMYNGMEVIRASVTDGELDLIDKDGTFMSAN
jgi:hypothetical protein